LASLATNMGYLLFSFIRKRRKKDWNSSLS